MTMTTKLIKLSSLRADLAKETEGEWIDSIRFLGARYRLRSLNEPGYQSDRSQLLQRLSRKHARKPIPQGELAPELGKLFADRLLLEWEGFDVEYTPEVALETLSDPAYRAVVEDIEDCASQVAALQVEFVKDLEKN